MAKKEEKDVCPICGCESWLGTSEGARCKNCGYIKGQPPVQKDKNK